MTLFEQIAQGENVEKRTRGGEPIVLVGTYRPENVAWIVAKRLYNLPLAEGGDATAYAKFTHVVLYAADAKPLAYTAKMSRVVGRDDLKALGYTLARSPHATRYVLFELGAETRAEDVLTHPATEVWICSSRWTGIVDASFYDRPLPACGGKSIPNIFEKLRPYFGKWKSARAFNPVQMDFFNLMNIDKKHQVPFPPPKHPSFTFIDLFAGIGGFRIALQRCGGKCVFTSEFDLAAQKTYEANFGDVPAGDITKQETHDLIPREFDIVCAGFPCQAFSLAGKRLGFNDFYKGMSRGTLFAEVVRICERHRPKAVFCENVKGLYIHDKGNTFKVIKNEFESIGYRFYYKILNSKDFGVPQTRERIYMVAFRDDYAEDGYEFPFPEPLGIKVTLNDIRERNVSAKYFLSDVYVETLRRHRARHEAAGHGFGYVIRDWDGVSGAIVCGGMGRETNLLKEEGGTPKGLVPVTHIRGSINKEGIRKMTPREWARLQGFPEDFKFVLSDVHLYKQFGNSVSIPVIERIAEGIVARIEAVDKSKKAK